jgi:hypothetical protein
MGVPSESGPATGRLSVTDPGNSQYQRKPPDEADRGAMRFARKKLAVAAVAALAVFCSGCQADVSADSVLSGRIVPTTTSTPLDGEFVVVDGCVYVQRKEDAETYPVIWPEGSEVSADDPSRVTLLNGSVSLNHKPQDFEVALVATESLAGKIQRGEIDGWERCTSNANNSILVLTVVGNIMLPQ